MQIKQGVAVFGLMLCMVPAMAQQGSAGMANGGLSLQMGTANGIKRLGLNWESPSLWHKTFSASRLDLVAEVGAAYWWSSERAGPSYAKNLWQIQATPMFRWWLGSRFFVEAGIGLALLTEDQIRDRHLGTKWQFSDQIGVGYQITPSSRVGLRYSHYSNAGMNQRNQGLDSFQLQWTQRF